MRQVPRIAARSEHRRFGRGGKPRFRRCRAAEDVQTGRLVRRDDRAVMVRYDASEQLARAGGKVPVSNAPRSFSKNGTPASGPAGSGAFAAARARSNKGSVIA